MAHKPYRIKQKVNRKWPSPNYHNKAVGEIFSKSKTRLDLMLWFLAYERSFTASWVGLKPLGAP